MTFNLSRGGREYLDNKEMTKGVSYNNVLLLSMRYNCVKNAKEKRLFQVFDSN